VSEQGEASNNNGQDRGSIPLFLRKPKQPQREVIEESIAKARLLWVGGAAVASIFIGLLSSAVGNGWFAGIAKDSELQLVKAEISRMNAAISALHATVSDASRGQNLLSVEVAKLSGILQERSGKSQTTTVSAWETTRR
jgi:hypothetical protein